MTIRVTQSMMNSQMIRNITTNMTRMNKLQEQNSTGMKINRPSDDPVGITFALRYRSEIDANEQYKKNVNATLSVLEYSDTTLGQAGDILQRVRELIIKGGNGALEQTSLDAIKVEIQQNYNQMIDIANTQFNGKYLFNGELTETRPYAKTELTDAIDLGASPPVLKAYHNKTDSGKINYELSAGLTLDLGVSGNDVFGAPLDPAATPEEMAGSDNIFALLQRAYDMLDSGDSEGVADLLDQFDTRMNTILTKRAEVGARVNRVEIIADRLLDIEGNLQVSQANVEDADIAEVLMKLKMEENIYQASLSVGARIIQPSLVDFLR